MSLKPKDVTHGYDASAPNIDTSRSRPANLRTKSPHLMNPWGLHLRRALSGGWVPSTTRHTARTLCSSSSLIPWRLSRRPLTWSRSRLMRRCRHRPRQQQSQLPKDEIWRFARLAAAGRGSKYPDTTAPPFKARNMHRFLTFSMTPLDREGIPQLMRSLRLTNSSTCP